MNEEQIKYDNETEHHLKKDVQIEWNKKIKKELEELNKFDKAVISLTVTK